MLMEELENFKMRCDREMSRQNEILSKVTILVEKHEDFIGDMKKWRLQNTGILMSIILAIFIQVCSFLFMWGKQTQQIENIIENQRGIMNKNNKQDDLLDAIRGNQRNSTRDTKDK